MEDLSRRTFRRGALLAGAGAVGAGALTACAPQTTESKSAGASAAADDATVNGDYPWPVNPPEIAAEDVEEEVSADIIIVGLGIAGVASKRARPSSRSRSPRSLMSAPATSPSWAARP